MLLHPPSQEEIILFSKYPRAGRVKTRLIPHLGSSAAAGLQKLLTEQALARAADAARLRPARLSLWYSGASRRRMVEWLGPSLPLRLQRGMDLGERMALAFRAAWKKGARRAVLIGTDCPDLSSSLIIQALAELARHDLVVGPASDGGYYLIGLGCHLEPAALASLFRGIPWGSDDVYRTTLDRAATARLTVFSLQVLHDIDRPEDLRYLGHPPHPQ